MSAVTLNPAATCLLVFTVLLQLPESGPTLTVASWFEDVAPGPGQPVLELMAPIQVAVTLAEAEQLDVYASAVWSDALMSTAFDPNMPDGTPTR
jgi:hypothetical protein